MPDDNTIKENPLGGLQVQMPLPANPLKEGYSQKGKPEAEIQETDAQPEGYELPEWAKLKPKVREAIAREYENLTEPEKEHLMLVWGLVVPIANALIQRGKLSEEDAELALIAALLHDIDKNGQEPFILRHHIDSAHKAQEILADTELIQQQKDRVMEVIKRHQGMPWMDDRLKALKNDQKSVKHINAIYKEEPLTESLDRFPPPNSEIAAIVFAADLLAIAALADHERLMGIGQKGLQEMTRELLDELNVGGFVKILNINMEIYGGNIEDALEKTIESLERNVTRLKNARPYNEEEQEKIKRTLEEERAKQEIEGREVAAKIEQMIGREIGDPLLQKAKEIAQRVKRRVAEEIQNAEGNLSYAENFRILLYVYYQEVLKYEQELRSAKRGAKAENPAETNDNGVHSVV